MPRGTCAPTRGPASMQPRHLPAGEDQQVDGPSAQRDGGLHAHAGGARQGGQRWEHGGGRAAHRARRSRAARAPLPPSPHLGAQAPQEGKLVGPAAAVPALRLQLLGGLQLGQVIEVLWPVPAKAAEGDRKRGRAGVTCSCGAPMQAPSRWRPGMAVAAVAGVRGVRHAVAGRLERSQVALPYGTAHEYNRQPKQGNSSPDGVYVPIGLNALCRLPHHQGSHDEYRRRPPCRWRSAVGCPATCWWLPRRPLQHRMALQAGGQRRGWGRRCGDVGHADRRAAAGECCAASCGGAERAAAAVRSKGRLHRRRRTLRHYAAHGVLRASRAPMLRCAAVPRVQWRRLLLGWEARRAGSLSPRYRLGRRSLLGNRRACKMLCRD